MQLDHERWCARVAPLAPHCLSSAALRVRSLSASVGPLAHWPMPAVVGEYNPAAPDAMEADTIRDTFDALKATGAGVGVTFAYPTKPAAAVPGATTTTSTQRTGWTEFSQAGTTHTTGGASTFTPSSGGVPAAEPGSSPINLQIHHNNNYQIVNNISIKVGNHQDEPDEHDQRARAQVPLVPKPPSSARPSSTKSVAPAPTYAPPAAAPAGQPGGPDKATAVSHYAVGKTIGEGTFGKVKKGIHKLTGLPVAIKILEKERIVDLADVERVKREIHILTRVRHPNVIRLYEVIDSPRHIFLVTEYVSGGELFDYIVSQGRVKDEQACRFFHQIVNGTDYFHNKSIIHRDLKPENLLLDADGMIKIVDFGLGNVAKAGKLLKTACGSPCYASPEMVGGKKYVGPGCDMWSLGVVLFALLCGYLPFEDANTSRLYEKIMGGEYELPDFLSADAKDLITRLLTTDPRKRYNAEQVRRHPWYARMQVPTDPRVTAAEAAAPIVPGPHASGRKVRETISGQRVDDETEIDEEVVRHLTMLGYHPQQVTESITSNRHDHFAATYHLLVLKKQIATKQQQQTSRTPAPPTAAPAANAARPPQVPRIPTGSGAAAGPSVPSAPVSSVHHPQPPSSQRPAAAYAARPQTQHAHRDAHAHAPQQPFAAPQPPPTSARVQSAGTVRPGTSAGANVTGGHVYATSARPTTSHGGAHAWHEVGSDAHGSGAAFYRPPSSASGGASNSSRAQQPQPPRQPPAVAHSARSATPADSPRVAYATARSGGRGSRASARAASSGTVPTVAQQAVFVSTPLEAVVSAPAYPAASPARNSARGPVGPATGRPMTSRITGSTGGVSHRLYLPPSERAAQELAIAASAHVQPQPRPATGGGTRPATGVAVGRPSTSTATRRPPSGARTQPRQAYASGGSRSSRDRDFDAGGALDDLDWTTSSYSSAHGANTTRASASSVSSSFGPSFDARLSALSFKPVRAILDELNRVLHANGLQFALLPPSGASSASPASPRSGKHAFASAGFSPPISISSLRPQPRPSSVGSHGVSDDAPSSAVIEVRSGPNRLQFHVSPLATVSAGLAQQLAADLDGQRAPPTHAGTGHAVRVKRVLGDATAFKEICAKILPQMRL